MSQPPSYPGSGDTPDDYGSDPSAAGNNYPPPPTHQSYGSADSGAGGYGAGGFGQQPYGQSGYGQQPGQYGSWQGGNDTARSTDGVSITAFVLSLTCCLSLIGLILGLVGLSRTKNGQRKGRWAAVSAIPLGIVGTLIAGAGVFGLVWMVQNSVTPENAEVGQCINIEEVDDDGEEKLASTKSDCDDDHDGEIMWVGTVGDIKEAAENSSRAQFEDLGDLDFQTAACEAVADPELAAKVEDSLRWSIISEDTTDPKDDVNLFCYIERTDGKKLTEKVG